jgi:hypothetical protein
MGGIIGFVLGFRVNMGACVRSSSFWGPQDDLGRLI